MIGPAMRRLALAVASTIAADPRLKRHHTGVVQSFDPTGGSLSSATVTITLDGGSTPVTLPVRDSYGAGAAPTQGDVVHVEGVGQALVVVDRLRRARAT